MLDPTPEPAGGRQRKIWRVKLAARWLGELCLRAKNKLKPKNPPSPWLQPSLGLVVLAVSVVSATFAGLNYYKSAKGRAAIVVDHYDDHQSKMTVPVLGEKNFHQLRMWITNYGQVPARIHNVAISPEFATALMTPDKEAERMDYVTKNKASIGTAGDEAEVVTGQRAFYSSNAGFPDEAWSEFTSKRQLLYVFALITFSDEMSGDKEVVTEICARLEPSLNTWNNCAGALNKTIRR